TSPKRILVVDDEPLVAFTLLRVLVSRGHTVEMAGDGEQALGLYEAGKYDLVISDFLMPKMDGLELARVIKERSAMQPLILLTAHAEALTSGKDRVSNVDLVVGKPI